MCIRDRVEGAPAATAAVADVIGHGKEVRLLTEQDVPEQEKVSYIAVCGRAAEIRQGIQESGHGLEQFFHRFTAAESGRTETHLFLAVRSQRGDILRSAFTYHFLHGKNLFDLLSSTLQRDEGGRDFGNRGVRSEGDALGGPQGTDLPRVQRGSAGAVHPVTAGGFTDAEKSVYTCLLYTSRCV